MSDNCDGKAPADCARITLSKLHSDPDWFLYDALNKTEPLGRQLKPWDALDEQQRAAIALHVGDMSLWRAESKVDPADADNLFERYPELLDLLV